MTIDSLLSAALEELQTRGSIDVPAWVAAHPGHATELRGLLPTMVVMHKYAPEKLADEETRMFALELYGDLIIRQEGFLWL